MDKSFTFFQNALKDAFAGSFAAAFDKVQDWTSMQSLIVVSAIDEHYDVLMSHEELKNVMNLEELHQKVLQKCAN